MKARQPHDLGLGTIKELQRNDLLDVLEDRYGKSGTVVTSQLPVAKWHEGSRMRPPPTPSWTD